MQSQWPAENYVLSYVFRVKEGHVNKYMIYKTMAIVCRFSRMTVVVVAVAVAVVVVNFSVPMSEIKMLA